VLTESGATRVAGRYSLYSDGVTSENYLRGVQEAAADGTVTFTSVYPAAYSGRWPHFHVEVYPSLADATRASGKLRTSQVALPERPSKRVYATDGYDASLGNLAQTSLGGAQRAGLTIQVSRPGAPPSAPPACRPGR
jgi:protocatechuate 3,4-dioxygenase beta subunit